MPCNLVKLHDLADAGLGKIVEAVNREVETKNKMEGDADLAAWVSWTPAQFEALGCSAVVAAAAVDALAGLRACYLTIKAQVAADKFPPNAL